MRLMDTLRYMAILFCVINTCILVIISAQDIILDRDTLLTGRDLLKIMFTAFAGTLPSLIYANSENASRKGLLIRKAAHFLLTAGAVFACQIYFGWIDAGNGVYLVITFLVIYVTIYIVTDIQERKLAEQLNERINAFHQAENETHQ